VDPYVKTSIAAAAAIALIGCLPRPGGAADVPFPSRPVRIIVPTSPSGGTDFLTRLMQQRLGERWAQPVVVDNRAGASGLIGLELCARAAADGHTLTIVNVGLIMTAQLSGKLSFERGGDFTPIALVANSELLMVVHPGVPAKSVKELVELARAKPRALNYASSGTGAVPHLATELFRSMAGIEMTHIPFKGSGPTLPAVLSGQVQLVLTSVATLIPHVQAGRLRGLAITGTKRLPTIPDVPTFAEAGFPRFEVSVWYGAFGPARMTAPLVARLNTDINWAAKQSDVAERLASAGMEPAGGLSAAQFVGYTTTEAVKWNAALKAAGMR
jgi:tripartite-type tricarboxylate transporter receptor subunit TctC